LPRKKANLKTFTLGSKPRTLAGNHFEKFVLDAKTLPLNETLVDVALPLEAVPVSRHHSKFQHALGSFRSLVTLAKRKQKPDMLVPRFTPFRSDL
jgi:hypothetical protein